jgi:polysaccharide export outer membrane protein
MNMSWTGCRVAVVVLAVLLAMPSVAPAQQPAPQLGSYVLGPGDVIGVSVAENDELARTVTIGPDGRVTLPLVGVVTAGGLTVEQLHSRLTQLYRQFIKGPQVALVIVQFRRIRVTVLGQVRGPGPRELPASATVLDAIAVAGGPADGAAATQAYLIRDQRQIITLNVQEILDGGGTTNLVLQDGDVIVVPAGAPIYVLGEVSRPGAYPIKGQTTLLDALLLAGGLTERASIPEARILRNRTEVVAVNLDGLLIRAEVEHNIALQPGDILFVPEDALREARVYVLGEVRSPGPQSVRATRTALQAVTAAGGPTARAALKNTYIVRRTAAGAQPQGQGTVLQVDLEALVRRGDVSKDVALRAGDVLYVPASRLSVAASFLQGILEVLTGISALIFFAR